MSTNPLDPVRASLAIVILAAGFWLTSQVLYWPIAAAAYLLSAAIVSGVAVVMTLRAMVVAVRRY